MTFHKILKWAGCISMIIAVILLTVALIRLYQVDRIKREQSKPQPKPEPQPQPQPEPKPEPKPNATEECKIVESTPCMDASGLDLLGKGCCKLSEAVSGSRVPMKVFRGKAGCVCLVPGDKIDCQFACNTGCEDDNNRVDSECVKACSELC